MMQHDKKGYSTVPHTPLPSGWEKLYRRILKEQIYEDLASKGMRAQQIRHILKKALEEQNGQ